MAEGVFHDKEVAAMVSSLFLLRRYHRPQRHDPRRTTSGGKPI